MRKKRKINFIFFFINEYMGYFFELLINRIIWDENGYFLKYITLLLRKNATTLAAK